MWYKIWHCANKQEMKYFFVGYTSEKASKNLQKLCFEVLIIFTSEKSIFQNCMPAKRVNELLQFKLYKPKKQEFLYVLQELFIYTVRLALKVGGNWQKAICYLFVEALSGFSNNTINYCFWTQSTSTLFGSPPKDVCLKICV